MCCTNSLIHALVHTRAYIQNDTGRGWIAGVSTVHFAENFRSIQKGKGRVLAVISITESVDLFK